MNKRLLFVDDDPLVLDGLRRALHGMRQTWEMNFVDSAEAVLNVVGDRVGPSHIQAHQQVDGNARRFQLPGRVQRVAATA